MSTPDPHRSPRTRLAALLLLAACTKPSDAVPPTVAPAPEPTVSRPPEPVDAPIAPEPLAPEPLAPEPRAPVAPEPSDPDVGSQAPRQTPRWPLSLDRDLPPGCLAWSKDQAAAVCVLGGESHETGHAFTFSFIGRDPREFSAGEWPSIVRGLRPLLVGSARTRVTKRLTAGKYESIPPASGQLTPQNPLETDRYILRWRREKTGRTGTADQARDIYTDTIQLACKRSPDRFRTVLRRTIENPQSSTARVHDLPPDLLLIQRTNISRRGDDDVRTHEAVLVDLRVRGC